MYWALLFKDLLGTQTCPCPEDFLSHCKKCTQVTSAAPSGGHFCREENPGLGHSPGVNAVWVVCPAILPEGHCNCLHSFLQLNPPQKLGKGNREVNSVNDIVYNVNSILTHIILHIDYFS